MGEQKLTYYSSFNETWFSAPESLSRINPDAVLTKSGVLNVITDRKLAVPSTDLTTVDHYTAQVVSYSDYFPFGMQMPGRHGSSAETEYGFNGMRKDDEIKGEGNSYDFGARMYDPRVGRWLSTDPLASKQAGFSPFKAFFNNPILWIDPDGMTEYETYILRTESGEYVGKLYREVSNKLMSGGKTMFNSTFDKSEGYDYRHVTTLTISDDGVIMGISKTKTEILYGNGIKDVETYGAAKEKGDIYEPFNLSDFLNADFLGDGDESSGGWNLTTPKGSPNGCGTKSLSKAASKDIQMFLDGATSGKKYLNLKLEINCQMRLLKQ